MIGGLEMRKLTLLFSVVLIFVACKEATVDISAEDVPPMEEVDFFDFEVEEIVQEGFFLEESCNLKEYPQIEKIAPPKSKEPVIDLRLLGRLADGIWKVTTSKGKRPFWQCGEGLEGEEAKDRAILWASNILKAIKRNTYKGKYTETLNVWGVAGVIANESSFDLCAFGLHPRKEAYRLGLLERQKHGISHTKEEVLAVINSKKMKRLYAKSGFDLGPMQLLSRFYRGPIENLLTWKALDIQVHEMVNRQRWKSTKRPWLYWRSWVRTDWYDKKIVRWAKLMGAKTGEI